MGFKTFAIGDILTASDLNTYLMKQVIVVCTSVTRPSTPVEGMTIAETDTDKLLTYNGTTWVEISRYNAGTSTASMDPAFTATSNTVYRRGMWGWAALTCNRPGGSLAAGVPVTAATLPSGYRPAVGFDTTAMTAGGITCTASVDTGGVINVRPSALISAATSIVFTPVAFPLA